MLKIRILLITTIFLLLLIFSFSCSANGTATVTPTSSSISQASLSPSDLPQQGNSVSATAAIPSISVEDAYKLIQENQGNPDFVILDVRTFSEFSSGHLEGAINIDYYASDFKAKVNQLDQNKEYLVYCRSGVRGAASVQIMLDSGFTRVQNLSGGILRWIAAGYPTMS